jgi:hypothetical protein
VEQEIAPAGLDPVTGLMEKTAERLQKDIKDMPPSVTRMRDPLHEDGLGCHPAVCGADKTTREAWNNRSGHMISLRVTYRHSDADEIDTRSTLQRS